MRHTTSDASHIYHATASAPSGGEVRACNCTGPLPGDPVCPCMMPAYREREAGKRALELLRWPTTKPRFRVKAGRRVVDA